MTAFFPTHHQDSNESEASSEPPACAGGCKGPAAVLCALMLPAAACWAAPAEENTSLDDRVALNGHSLQDRVTARPASRVSVTQSAAQPLATAQLSSAQGSWYGRAAMARQTMVWGQPFASNALRVGLGVEQRGPAIGGGLYQNPYQGWRAGASGDSGVLLGLAMPMTARSHVFLQTPLLEGQRNAYEDLLPSVREPEGRQVRVGMVFNTSKPYADLRKGLRMELSGQSSLSFKPRGGGKMAVTFQKIF